MLEDSPSLKNEISAAIIAEMKRGSRKAVRDLEKYADISSETLARICKTAYTVEQILGDWFPPEPTKLPCAATP